MELIDIGANLTHVSFEQDFKQVVDDARDVGLKHIILTGTDLETSLAAQAMATENSTTFSSTAGFHPHVASTFDAAALDTLTDLLQDERVVAVGETGLDFNRNYSPREDQIRAFEQHLELAKQTQKPLFLHQRDAHDEFFSLLSQYRPQVSGGVVHCFTDEESALRAYLELDMYIGITGWICDERRGLDLQQHVRLIPDDRLLIETDAPYLLPRSIRPKPKSRRNEPKHLVEVLKTVAFYRGQSEQEVAEMTTANAKRLFGIGNR